MCIHYDTQVLTCQSQTCLQRNLKRSLHAYLQLHSWTQLLNVVMVVLLPLYDRFNSYDLMAWSDLWYSLSTDLQRLWWILWWNGNCKCKVCACILVTCPYLEVVLSLDPLVALGHVEHDSTLWFLHISSAHSLKEECTIRTGILHYVILIWSIFNTSFWIL